MLVLRKFLIFFETYYSPIHEYQTTTTQKKESVYKNHPKCFSSTIYHLSEVSRKLPTVKLNSPRCTFGRIFACQTLYKRSGMSINLAANHVSPTIKMLLAEADPMAVFASIKHMWPRIPWVVFFQQKASWNLPKKTGYIVKCDPYFFSDKLFHHQLKGEISSPCRPFRPWIERSTAHACASEFVE